MKLGQNLRYIRAKNGYSPIQFSNLLKIDPKELLMYESNEKDPPLKLLCQLMQCKELVSWEVFNDLFEPSITSLNDFSLNWMKLQKAYSRLNEYNRIRLHDKIQKLITDQEKNREEIIKKIHSVIYFERKRPARGDFKSTIGPTGRILFMSPDLEKYYGLTSGELEFVTVFDFFPKTLHWDIRKILQETPVNRIIAHRARRIDGYFEWKICKNEQGNILANRKTVKDTVACHNIIN